MPSHIRVDQDVLTNAAGNHREASDHLAAVSASHDGIRAALNSLGPVYGDFRRAVEALLDARKGCYDEQASEHSCVADNLTVAVATWNDHDDDAAAAFRRLGDRR